MLKYVKTCLLIPLLLLITACGTNTARRDALLAEMRAANAPLQVVGKVQALRPLDFADLTALRKSQVREQVIADYIDLTRTHYILTFELVNRLSRDGFSKEFIDFLLATPILYPQVIRIIDSYPVYYPVFVPVRKK